jgi:hypothetical protein
VTSLNLTTRSKEYFAVPDSPGTTSPEAEPMVEVDGLPDLETPVEELVDAMPDVPVEVDNDPPVAPKREGRSNRNIAYVCGVCGRAVGRENLVVQRTQFLEMGINGKLLKTRTRGWICRNVENNCLDKDAEWKADRYTGSPGLADTIK